MRVIEARNTNDMTYEVLDALEIEGVRSSSRNGEVLKFPEPVTFVYTHPWERVNMIEARDANPFFHVMEAMAMLANHNSVEWMTFFNKNMRNYSDDGVRYNAFYGERILEYPIDQLAACIIQLQADPGTRAAVIQIWEKTDLITSSVDRACNMSMVFNLRPSGDLGMTLFNRSNDLVWGGVSGANIVHFSMFHEIVARGAGLPMGMMHVVANDAHVYTDNGAWQNMKEMEEEWPQFTSQVPIGEEFPLFMAEAWRFVFGIQENKFPTIEPVGFLDPFIAKVAVPMYNAWVYRKRKDDVAMWHAVSQIEDEAWSWACTNWLERRNGSAKNT